MFTQETVHKQTYDTAEYWYRQGLIDEKQWTLYCCIWRNSAPRLSNLAQKHDGCGPDPTKCRHL